MFPNCRKHTVIGILVVAIGHIFKIIFSISFVLPFRGYNKKKKTYWQKNRMNLPYKHLTYRAVEVHCKGFSSDDVNVFWVIWKALPFKVFLIH